MKIYLICTGLLVSTFSFTQNSKQLQDTTKPGHPSSANPVDSNILIVVNGILAGTIRELKKDVNTLFSPDIIQSMNVLKDKHATDKYGARGKAGVIEFQLKDVKIIDAKLTASGNTDHIIFEKVEIESSFPGGSSAWRKFLERNVNAAIPSENFAPPGTYTVIVQFVVDKEGNISDVRPLTKHGFGMEEEVVKVIFKGPKWLPAINNGSSVKAYRKQPVTFMVVSDIELSTYSLTAGKPNDIEITVDRLGIKPEDLEITLSNGSISHNQGEKYTIMVDKPGRIFLTVKRKTTKKKDMENFGTVALEVN